MLEGRLRGCYTDAGASPLPGRMPASSWAGWQLLALELRLLLLAAMQQLVVTLPACGVLHATIGVAQGAAWGAMGGMPNCALRLAHPESALGDAE